MAENFADRLLAAIREKGAPAVVGIDPVYTKLPAVIREHRDFNDETDLEASLDAILEFSRRVIHTVAPLVPAVKINIAYFEKYYQQGFEAYFDLVQEAAQLGLVVIADIKRGDIGHSSQLYAQAHLAEPQFGIVDDMVAPDAATINIFAGADAADEFITVAHEQRKGIFPWVRASNPSAVELQAFTNAQGQSYVEFLATLVGQWADKPELIGDSGYSCVGAVVGATADTELTAKLRALMPKSIFLVPGFGAQGGGGTEIKPCFNPDGQGAIVNSSRGIIYAFDNPKYADQSPDNWEKCVELACKDFVTALQNALAS